MDFALRYRLDSCSVRLVVFLAVAACVPRYSRWSNGAQDPAAPAVVFLGDSLTFGQGLPADSAYPAVIAERMRREGIQLPVVNAGVSGDTTADGLARLPDILSQPVAVLVVALGANDGLRHDPLDSMRRNLTEIVERARRAHAEVVMVGMKAPRFDPAYRAGFEQVFAEVAREYHLAYVPFLLRGVGGVPRLNQADGIHPTAEGQRIMADVVWPTLEPVVRRAWQRFRTQR
jgi:acyl-CoA thioesterase-1